MAKNEPLGTVTYLRKDTNFFKEGVWYISTPCLKHGLVDEEVTWDEAKTPHHAGLIADQRHAQCNVASEAHDLYFAGLEEIESARRLRDQQKLNVESARARVEQCSSAVQTSPKSRKHARELVAATAYLARHERALVESEQRVLDTIAANGPDRP